MRFYIVCPRILINCYANHSVLPPSNDFCPVVFCLLIVYLTLFILLSDPDFPVLRLRRVAVFSHYQLTPIKTNRGVQFKKKIEKDFLVTIFSCFDIFPHGCQRNKNRRSKAVRIYTTSSGPTGMPDAFVRMSYSPRPRTFAILGSFGIFRKRYRSSRIKSLSVKVKND